MDWLIDNWWLAWLGLAIVLAIEAATVDFVFLMPAGGAAAGAAAALGAPFPLQVVGRPPSRCSCCSSCAR